MKTSVTVREIAKDAGLSPSTVSAVLNNRQAERRISGKSVQKVLGSARKLGYVPNIAARRLRAHNSHRRELVLSILTSYEAPLLLVSHALHSLEKVVDSANLPNTSLTVTIEMFHAGRLKELPGLVEGKRFNGAIITNTIAQDDDFLATAKLPFPVVLLGRSLPGYPSVSEKPEALGAKVAEILSSVGRRRLAVLCPRLLTQATQGRLRAFFSHTEEIAGLPPEKIVSEGLSEADGFVAIRDYLKGGGRCDGLFTLTDSLAVGAYHAIKGSGRTIPGDIAVVGVGDHEASPFLDPPLTSFSRNQELLNETAAKTLLSLVNGENVREAPIEVPITMILRGSTGHSSEKRRIRES